MELGGLESKVFVLRLGFLGSVNIRKYILQTFTLKLKRLTPCILNKNLNMYYSYEFYEVYSEE